VWDLKVLERMKKYPAVAGYFRKKRALLGFILKEEGWFDF
jgi:hypothetical protein